MPIFAYIILLPHKITCCITDRYTRDQQKGKHMRKTTIDRDGQYICIEIPGQYRIELSCDFNIDLAQYMVLSTSTDFTTANTDNAIRYFGENFTAALEHYLYLRNALETRGILYFQTLIATNLDA